MPEHSRLRVRISPAATQDIAETMEWTTERFGARAAQRYGRLIWQAIKDVRTDPERPGAKERRELGAGIRTYHLHFSRGRSADAGALVKKPRHLLVYRNTDGWIEIVRVLHDMRELDRNIPKAHTDD